MPDSVDKLFADLNAVSKHSHYQALHPMIHAQFDVPDSYKPRKLLEAKRDDFVRSHVSFDGAKVVDIGANTGYFTLAAIDHGASHVDALEGNARHATFLHRCAKALGLSEKITVTNRYVNFSPYDLSDYDVALCYNVLHHLGDDFQSGTAKQDALHEMGQALRNVVSHSKTTVFQMGFNWKGDRALPLTTHGTKREILDFVTLSLDGIPLDMTVGLYDPQTEAYQAQNDNNFARLDALGEFANRPLFIIKAI